jgi:hypothetical protein
VPRSGSTYYAPRTRDAGCRASSQAVLQVRGDALCVQGAGWLSVAHDDHDVDRLCHECRLGVPQMKGDCATNVSWRYPAARSRRLKAVPVRLFSASRWFRIQLLEQHSLSKCQVTPAHANRDSAGLSGTCSPIRAGVCVKQLYLVVVCKHRDAFGRRRQREPHYPTPASAEKATNLGLNCLIGFIMRKVHRRLRYTGAPGSPGHCSRGWVRGGWRAAP